MASKMKKQARCPALAFVLCLSLVACSNQASFNGPIQTIVVLVMENRSFDHMLGWMKKSNPEIDGVTGNESNTVSAADPNSQKFFFREEAEYVDPDPGHSFQAIREQIFGSNDTSANAPPMNGFAQEAARRRGLNFSQTVMNGFRPEAVPVYNTLVSEFAVFDRWFASVPASTQPNRLFVHSGTSHGATSNNAKLLADGYPQKTIFDSVHESGLSFGIYYQNIPATLFYSNLRKLKYAGNFHPYGTEFKSAANKGKLPNYVVVEQRYMDSKLSPANDDHPSHDVAEGQKFVKEVYETLRSSPQWNQTLFLITYDEHGGFYDHVATPVKDVPSPDDFVGPEPFFFKFDRLGVRVPTIMISPWINPGTVVHRANGPYSSSEFEHSSICATVKKIFNLKSDFLTKRDAWAGTFESVVLSRTTPRTDCPVKLPDAPKLRKTEANEAAKISEFQEELVQLAAQLNGDYTLKSYPNQIGKTMNVKEATKYLEDSVRRFFEATRMAKKLGANEEEAVKMRPSLTSKPTSSSQP